MNSSNGSRYEQVSRRAVLKGTLGSGLLALTAAACGNADAQVLAGNVAVPAPTTTSTTTTTAPAAVEADENDSDERAQSAQETVSPAVVGEIAIAFTYSRVGAGKIESPYVAVWVEDADGELLDTVALYYEQTRRGERWLDHLERWYPRNETLVAAGGADVTTTISSATRAPGEYAVTWSGIVDGVSVPAGDYFICIESTREDGPYSLIREPFALEGLVAPTPLADAGELSAASVQTNV